MFKTAVDLKSGGYVGEGGYDVMVDEVDANTTYIGFAKPGTKTSVLRWSIRKILVDGAITSTKYANGDPGYKFEWDERATYDYTPDA